MQSVINFFKSEKFVKVSQIILKILAITLFVAYFVRLFLNDNFIWIINKGLYGEIFYDKTDVAQSFTRWFHTATICLIPTAAFFKSKLLSRLTVVTGLVCFVLDLVFFKDTMVYFTTNSFRGFLVSEGLRVFEYVFEISLIGCFLALYSINNFEKLMFKSWREVGKFFIYFVFVMLISIPVYLPQSFFGFSETKMSYFGGPHLLWIGSIFVTFFVLTGLFRHDTKEHKEIILCYLSLFLFQHYNSIYLMDLSASRLPFQLCNLGAYFILILFIFRNKKWAQKFFDFSFIANVPGAFIAIIAVDVREGIFSYWNIHYYLEHTWVFILPLLFFTFGVFSFPREKAMKHFVIGFSIYFVCCAFLGVLFNCAFYKEGSQFFNRVNYFYMFSDLILKAFPFMAFSYKPEVSIVWGGYSFHPFYMVAIYLAFIVICYVVQMMNEKFYAVAKDHIALRKLNKQLKEKN